MILGQKMGQSLCREPCIVVLLWWKKKQLYRSGQQICSMSPLQIMLLKHNHESC